MLGTTEYDARLVKANMVPFQRFMDDPEVFEVRINKFGQVVCDTVKGRKIYTEPAMTENYLNSLLDFMLHQNGLDKTAANYVEFPDGSRGTFCVPPAVVDGSMLVAIRKHLPVSKTLEDLEAENRFAGFRHCKSTDDVTLASHEQHLLELLASGRVVDFFRLGVQSKLNICIAGSTGSGKTVLTRTLLAEVPVEERVILLEDTHEISNALQHEVGFMLYGNQKGRLSPQECLKACMRLSPDRIFLTELRDDAAWDYLCMSNTGHPGGVFSTHASSASLTKTRIAQLVKQSSVGAQLDWEVITSTVNMAIDVVVYMEKRQIVEILYDPLDKKKRMSLG
ncbi:TPA: ATPase, T2SS/T4P/T4SS family [Pseudomonas putida]